jgi:hypothetical protein
MDRAEYSQPPDIMPNQLFPDGMSPDEDFKYDIESLGKSTAEVRGHLVDWFLKQDGDDHDYLALVNECICRQ